jgi:DNA-binding transcriptional regulator GbsR (MarR family)
MSELFNKRDYKVLEELIANNCVSPIASLNRVQLMNLTELSSSKIRSVIKYFLMTGLILEGIKDGQYKTYYVSESGIENFKRTHNLTDKNIQDLINENEGNE